MLNMLDWHVLITNYLMGHVQVSRQSMIIRSKLIMWCMEETKGHGENGWREVVTSQSFIQWIIPVLEEDVPYITSPCRLLHETWVIRIKLRPGYRISFPVYKYRTSYFKSVFGYSFGKSNVIVIRELRNVSSSIVYCGRHYGAKF